MQPDRFDHRRREAVGQQRGAGLGVPGIAAGDGVRRSGPAGQQIADVMEQCRGHQSRHRAGLLRQPGGLQGVLGLAYRFAKEQGAAQPPEHLQNFVNR